MNIQLGNLQVKADRKIVRDLSAGEYELRLGEYTDTARNGNEGKIKGRDGEINFWRMKGARGAIMKNPRARVNDPSWINILMAGSEDSDEKVPWKRTLHKGIEDINGLWNKEAEISISGADEAFIEERAGAQYTAFGHPGSEGVRW